MSSENKKKYMREYAKTHAEEHRRRSAIHDLQVRFKLTKLEAERIDDINKRVRIMRNSGLEFEVEYRELLEEKQKLIDNSKERFEKLNGENVDSEE